MDPVEPSSTRTPLQVYNSLCIRLRNFVSRLKVLIIENNVEKCREQLLRIKEVYSEFVSLDIGEENFDIKPSKPEIGYLVLDACDWVRSLEKSGPSGIDFGCHEKVKQSSKTELIYVTESPLLPKFGGDVLGFLLWKSLVLARIARSASEEEKFVVLLDCTEGSAHDLVDSFISSPDRVDRALVALEEQYGNEQVILFAYLDLVKAFPPIEHGDGDSLFSYVCLLYRGVSLTKVFPSFDLEFSVFDFRKKSMEKLPYSLQVKWVRRLIAAKPGVPTFEEFVLFLDEESKVLKHPWLKKPMNPSHCMATVCEPIPPVNPRPIIVGSGRVCSPPSLMSLHVRIPPLMSLSVIPWFCLKTDPSLSQVQSFQPPSSDSPKGPRELPSSLINPFDCAPSIVNHPPQPNQPSATPVSAVHFSPASTPSQPSSTQLPTSLRCSPESPSQVSSPCSPFRPVIQPCSSPDSLASPNRFGLLWQFISAFLCNLLGFYHLFGSGVLCS